MILNIPQYHALNAGSVNLSPILGYADLDNTKTLKLGY